VESEGFAPPPSWLVATLTGGVGGGVASGRMRVGHSGCEGTAWVSDSSVLLFPHPTSSFCFVFWLYEWEPVFEGFTCRLERGCLPQRKTYACQNHELTGGAHEGALYKVNSNGQKNIQLFSNDCFFKKDLKVTFQP